MGTKIFIINPGSTSTKLALFEDEECLIEKTVRHSAEDLKPFTNIMSQLEYRFDIIRKAIEEDSIDLSAVQAFVGRGGLLRPLLGGTYLVNENMLEDLKTARYGEHASNLGAVFASMFAKKYGKAAYVVNPVVVDELMEIARLTGLPEIQRVSIFHALNQKAVAQYVSKEKGISYEKSRFIIAHLGGGVTIGVHDNGRVTDVNNGLEEGPFTPERAGTLPTRQLVDLCYSGRYTKAEVLKKLVGNGGFIAHSGTSDCQLLEKRAQNDEKTKILLEAFIYRVSREICASAAAIYGKVDYIIITGGLAYSNLITDGIKKRVSFLSPVLVYPGENEMNALAKGTLSVLFGNEDAKEY